MTNAEKYLKDGVEAKEIWHKYQEFLMNNDKTENACTFVEFMEEQSKPTLTEDERVILKNIKGDCKYVGRKYDNERNYSEGILYICARTSSSVEYKYLGCYSHLFQFIKERRRISNRGTFERRIKC